VDYQDPIAIDPISQLVADTRFLIGRKRERGDWN
jgi:hypothetical protein